MAEHDSAFQESRGRARGERGADHPGAGRLPRIAAQDIGGYYKPDPVKGQGLPAVQSHTLAAILGDKGSDLF